MCNNYKKNPSNLAVYKDSIMCMICHNDVAWSVIATSKHKSRIVSMLIQKVQNFKPV